MTPEAMEMSKFLSRCGIPKNLHQKQLADFGVTGKFYSDILQDYSRWKDYIKCAPVLNLYGNVIVAEDISAMIGRALILYEKTCLVLPARRLSIQSEAEYVEALDQKYLVLWDLFKVGCSNRFLDTQIEDVEEFIVRYIKEGGKVIISSEVPVKKMEWYSNRFLTFLQENGKEVEVDTRYRVNC